MDKKVSIKYGEDKLTVDIPKDNFLYHIAPKDVKPVEDEGECIRRCLRFPISSSSLYEQLKSGMKVVILVDDLTRPTPKDRILPILLDELNKAGVKDKDISAVIALGTHRYMTDEEIIENCGKEAARRIEITNHQWKNKDIFVNLGSTKSGTPVVINKKIAEANYVIGIGSVVPHEQAGFSGGAKIVQPGVCSWETTGYTHMLAAEDPDYLGIAGRVANNMRLEIEEVGKKAGLNFIINVVIDRNKNLVEVVAGDPVDAQRKAIKSSSEVYIREIPEQADILVVSSYPAEIDYWQGVKPLCYAQRGVKKGGVVILVGPFPDGVADPHPDLEKYARVPLAEIRKLINEGKIEDLVCAAALVLHALILERCKVICVSEGMSIKQKENLGFEHAENISPALEKAFAKQGKDAKVGVIDYGGDVLAKVRD